MKPEWHLVVNLDIKVIYLFSISYQVQARQVPPHPPQVVQKVRQKVMTKNNQAAEVLPLPNQPVQAIQGDLICNIENNLGENWLFF